ncbi:RNA polymerase sigma factor [Sorangium sp. So ce341]|uniref:RNA polymerase sigma factor n=1 Tax=Sorangium sp. So ce341 TaxID=3133302 RepID=UPI003F5E4D25
MDEAGRAAERVARESYGRLVAFLSARTRDVAGAEDALGEAFTSALRVWPVDGVPDNPDAWLLTAARRRQTDTVRRTQTRKAGEEHLQLIGDEIEAVADEQDVIPDRRLALMFACAHPAIERAVRTPLILQTILGLSAEDIAAAFMIPPKTMGQRLVRAKTRIRNAGIPFRVPDPEELPERLDAVLDAIYAAYSKGWNEVGDDAIPELADEAIWLGHMVVSLLPDEPEAKGMLALMFYTAARRAARRDAAGAYVPLEQQDTGLWNNSLIALAECLLHQANAAGPSGRYQIEAAIQSAHVARRLAGFSNWPAVVALYDHLLALTGSPVVILNRAVARAEVDGPRAALADLTPLEADKRMLSYQPYWAAKGHLLSGAGDTAPAVEALTIAIGLTTDEALKAYLLKRLASLQAT